MCTLVNLLELEEVFGEAHFRLERIPMKRLKIFGSRLGESWPFFLIPLPPRIKRISFTYHGEHCIK